MTTAGRRLMTSSPSPIVPVFRSLTNRFTELLSKMISSALPSVMMEMPYVLVKDIPSPSIWNSLGLGHHRSSTTEQPSDLCHLSVSRAYSGVRASMCISRQMFLPQSGLDNGTGTQLFLLLKVGQCTVTAIRSTA